MRTCLNPRAFTRGLRASVMDEVEFGLMIRISFLDTIFTISL
jgi:hypothetical protein